MCEWKCPHAECNHPCSEFCDRKPCNEPCPKILFCGHPCNGLCGEICPPQCPSCARVKMLNKDRTARYCYHLRNDSESTIILFFDLDISTWSVNTGLKWTKWTKGFIQATVRRRLSEFNARHAQNATRPSHCASVTVTGSNLFTLT